MPSHRIAIGLALATAVTCCLLASVSTVPIEAPGMTLSDPNACTVCIKRAPLYVPHTNIQWSQGGKICVRKTFSKQDWPVECETAATEFEELTDLPNCQVCHENSSLVEAWHKMWTEEGGRQCASVVFVPKGRTG